jgi:hypothetical protein
MTLPAGLKADSPDKRAVALVLVKEIEVSLVLDVEQERRVLRVCLFEECDGLVPLPELRIEIGQRHR